VTWRNTVLEDWPAQGRIPDPDMFRTDADTSLIFHLGFLIFHLG
jgi:hypothetical protein